MLQKLATPLDWQKVSKLLEEINIRNEVKRLSFNPNKLARTSEREDLLKELEAKTTKLPLNITYQLVHLFEHDIYLLFEPAYHFNKYRLSCLRVDFYHEHTPTFDLLKYKNFCRTKQEEAIKAGLSPNIWQDELGDYIFGASESPGYFGGSGSSGWKYIAFTNYLLDVFTQSKRLKLFRFSPYDNLMTQGKISSLGNLLAKSDEDSIVAIQQFLSRKMNLSSFNKG